MLVLDTGIEYWHIIFVLDNCIGYCYWIFVYDIWYIENWYWMLILDTGIGYLYFIVLDVYGHFGIEMVPGVLPVNHSKVL